VAVPVVIVSIPLVGQVLQDSLLVHATVCATMSESRLLWLLWSQPTFYDTIRCSHQAGRPLVAAKSFRTH
jgi:hypothetical protein